MAGYKASLALEKGFSVNSIQAYLTDVRKLKDLSKNRLDNKGPLLIDLHDLLSFVAGLEE